MSLRLVGCALVLGVLATLAGCASARVVMRNGDQGVVAIPRNHNKWPSHYRSKAERLMAEHFPEGYVIEHEEEMVVGQVTHYDENHSHDVAVLGGAVSLGTGATQGTATTTDATEYRIYYRRR